MISRYLLEALLKVYFQDASKKTTFILIILNKAIHKGLSST